MCFLGVSEVTDTQKNNHANKRHFKAVICCSKMLQHHRTLTGVDGAAGKTNRCRLRDVSASAASE